MVIQSEEYPNSTLARNVVESLIPNPDWRSLALHRTTESIRLVHDVNPGSWAISLRDQQIIRLNVGRIETIVIGPHYVRLAVPEVEHSTENWVDLLHRVGVPAQEDDPFRAVPGVTMVAIADEHLPVALPILKSFHETAMGIAANKVRTRTNYYGSHSRAVVEFLREFIDPAVPDPAYGEIKRPYDPGPVEVTMSDEIHRIGLSIRNAGMRITDRDLRRYHLSLQIRKFVILSGLSGTGKTWLTEAYANAIDARHETVAVAPNWMTNEDLLGYMNPLTQHYHDTSASRFIRESAIEWQAANDEGRAAQPFHLVLDEMNLARVEHYFAQFLSAMEVRARRGIATMAIGAGDTLQLTPNLFVIGTVNVDETTHGFADKIYDRAQMLEIGASFEDYWDHTGNEPFREVLMDFWTAVSEAKPFTFRVIDDIKAYIAKGMVLGASWEELLDEQLLQKVLPKINGHGQATGSALEEIVRLSAGRFPLTHDRAVRMLHGLRTYGTATYFG